MIQIVTAQQETLLYQQAAAITIDAGRWMLLLDIISSNVSAEHQIFTTIRIRFN